MRKNVQDLRSSSRDWISEWQAAQSDIDSPELRKVSAKRQAQVKSSLNKVEGSFREARTSPVPVSGGLTFRTVSAGEEFSCGVTTGGRVFCWGDNLAGELGTGTNTGPQGCEFGRPCSRTPVPVVGGLTFTTVSAGGSHACGVTSDGAAYCWGDNSAGALGDGTTTSQTAPVLVAGGLHFKAVSAGAQSTCAVTTDNAAYCWGDNSLGQLGDGTTASRSTPGPVVGGLSFVAIRARFQAVCGVLASGAAFCWGDNSHGQLGDGTTTQRTAPVAVAGDLSFAVVDAHGQNACGVTLGGHAYCWGDNFAGQLGSGTNTASATPVQVVQ